jgi:hypothetical protein
MKIKSLTGRTVVTAIVSDKGATSVVVTRNGQTVGGFSLPNEDGLNSSSTLTREGNDLVIRNEGPFRSMVEVERIALPEEEPTKAPVPAERRRS